MKEYSHITGDSKEVDQALRIILRGCISRLSWGLVLIGVPLPHLSSDV